jgi:ribose-phosphate pyrophosphokinase
MGNVDKAETLNIIGDVAGMQALLIDDEIDTAGSLVTAAAALRKAGATNVYACCTHPVFSRSASKRIANSPIKEVVVSDTIPIQERKRNEKITVLSMASLLGEAIHRIHAGLSVGAMFE